MKDTVKSVKTELAHLEIEYSAERERFQTSQARMTELNKRRDILNKKLEKITAKLTISEHAIIRYIERVIGINIDEITNKILTPEIEAMYNNLGSGKFPIEGGKARVVIKNNVIVTVEH